MLFRSNFGHLQSALTAESERSASLTDALHKRETEIVALMLEFRSTQSNLEMTLEELKYPHSNPPSPLYGANSHL